MSLSLSIQVLSTKVEKSDANYYCGARQAPADDVSTIPRRSPDWKHMFCAGTAVQNGLRFMSQNCNYALAWFVWVLGWCWFHLQITDPTLHLSLVDSPYSWHAAVLIGTKAADASFECSYNWSLIPHVEIVEHDAIARMVSIATRPKSQLGYVAWWSIVVTMLVLTWARTRRSATACVFHLEFHSIFCLRLLVMAAPDESSYSSEKL